jgi:AcrR family transcriptional regulator
MVRSVAVNVRSDHTRERIHAAGLELFDERGYTGTSVRDLAERCGLTPGALYNHYASKDDLLFAIVDRVHDLADDVLAGALREADGGAEAKLEAMASAFTLFHIERPAATRVANRDYVYLPAGERESVIRRRRRVRALFAETLRQGEREDSFSFAELGSEDAVEAASMAILNMAVWVADWFDPSGPRSAEDTAALHGRLALRIAQSSG